MCDVRENEGRREDGWRATDRRSACARANAREKTAATESSDSSGLPLFLAPSLLSPSPHPIERYTASLDSHPASPDTISNN